MIIVNYNRFAAKNYALKWALKRNPKYYSFDNLGGDCTNFVSQCIYAGSNVMNYTPLLGWYYKSLNDRTPSWTGVNYLFNFLVNNKDVGPFAKLTNLNDIDIGDVIQLGDKKQNYYHTLIVTNISNNQIYTSAHSQDSMNRPLYSYAYYNVRSIHILGIRK